MNWWQKLIDALNKLWKKPPPVIPPTPPSPPDPTLPKEMQELVAEVNRRRASEGKKAYTKQAALTKAAQIHADYMARTNNMSHTGEGGSNFLQRGQAAGYTGQLTNEIIAGDFKTVTSVVDAWMSSNVGHREALLSSVSDECGAGLGIASNGAKYWCMVFGNIDSRGLVAERLEFFLPEPLTPQNLLAAQRGKL